jgi:hypothetical protein
LPGRSIRDLQNIVHELRERCATLKATEQTKGDRFRIDERPDGRFVAIGVVGVGFALAADYAQSLFAPVAGRAGAGRSCDHALFSGRAGQASRRPLPPALTRWKTR